METQQTITKEYLLDYFKTNNSFVGILSTSQQVKYGKTKAGKPIYQIHPLKKLLPPFWITYGGNCIGKIIIQFKFRDWENDSKLPFAETISIIDSIKDDNINKNTLIKTLLFHHQIERKPFIKKNPILNNFEIGIKRQNLKDLTIFSIDPKGCIDIDDALSFDKIDENNFKIGVHIAQPICWLTKEEIIERSKNAISTLYFDENTHKNLWSDEITEKASLFVNQEKPAYSILFTVCDNKIIKIESFPSIIINKLNTNYDEIDFPYIIDCKKLTEKLINKQIDSHELVSYWMIQANQYIGTTFENIPFRSQNQKNIEDSNLDIKIKQVFMNMQLEGAFYSYDKDYHNSLNLNKYTHFTSPIRRIIDTIIHWNITYSDELKIDLDKINILDKRTKKFHQQLNLNNIIDKMPDEQECMGWLYSRDNNKCIVYFEELGFMRMKLWDDKFNYLYKENDIYSYLCIGKSYLFTIIKKKGFLPIQRLHISL